MPASGIVNFDGKEYVFPEGKSFGVLDWGRGVWTYKNTWYWGSASGQDVYKRQPVHHRIPYARTKLTIDG